MTIKRNILAACVLLSSLGLTKISLADIGTSRIDQRQENQQERIDQGVESGRLTEREANRLENQQTRLANHEEAAKADGVVTPGERARLTHHQNKANRTISRKKHNLRRD